jgi:hypothetical protein
LSITFVAFACGHGAGREVHERPLDRTEKLHDYQRIGSLQHVVHVAYDAPRIDVWSRAADGWTRESYGEGKRVVLPAIACELDVSEIFRDPLDPSQA